MPIGSGGGGATPSHTTCECGKLRTRVIGIGADAADLPPTSNTNLLTKQPNYKSLIA
jgi:hypothetical protein